MRSLTWVVYGNGVRLGEIKAHVVVIVCPLWSDQWVGFFGMKP
jgi:hypothetical protein